MLEPASNQIPEELRVQIKAEISRSKRLASWKLHPGHRVFEIDIDKGTIRPAPVVRSYELSGESRGRIGCKDGLLYIPALNYKNALKKLQKRLAEIIHKRP